MKHGGNVWDAGAPDEWLDFSANLRPEGMPGWVREVLHTAVEDACYYPDRSMRAAKAGLAAYLGVDEACVLPTAGGAAAIDLVLGTGKGCVHVHQPTFGEYEERARVHGRQVVDEAPVMPGDTVMLCNPNNPTGLLLRPDEVLAKHRQILSCGGELVVDEAFMDYCAEGSVCTQVTNGLTVVGSLTKILCVPGIRLGYLCAAPKLIASLESKALTWSLNVMASAVAAALPRHKTEMEADAALNAQRKQQLTDALQARGVRVAPSAAAFLLADFGRDMTETVARLKQKHILVRTCASFGLPANLLRLAVKTEEQNARLLEALWEKS